MSYDRIAGRLYNTPLLITPEKADVIEGVFRAYQEGRASELPQGEAPQRIELASALSLRRADGGYFMSTGGIAVVQVHGSLVQRGDSMDALSGMTGYNRIAGQLSAAMRDPGVRGVVLEIDSPGGEVPGLLEVAALVASSTKPVWAHANELAASAAYWLGSSAGKLFAPTTGMVGSIGVVMLHVDRSRQIEKAGLVYTPIFAGARKLEGSSIAPLSEGARAAAQARVDQVYSMFVEHVAKARGMTEQAVRDTEAGVFSVQEAVAMKLADGVATLGDVVQSMTDELNAGRLFGNPFSQARAIAGAQPEGHETMSNEKTTPAATSQPVTQQDVDAAKAAGIAEGKAAAAAEVTAAAKAATDRVKAITTSEAAATRPALAAHLAYETALSVDDAVALLAKAGPETTPAANPLAAAMAGTNPKVGADGEPKADASPLPVISAADVYGARKAQIHAVK